MAWWDLKREDELIQRVEACHSRMNNYMDIMVDLGNELIAIREYLGVEAYTEAAKSGLRKIKKGKKK